MSLEVKKSIKRYIPKVILIIMGLFVLGFAVKVAIWEERYYREKEGSERELPQVVGDMDNEVEEVDETEVTEVQKVEYTVPADQPRYIYIDKLGINKARIMSVGVNSKGQMLTPRSIYDAAWYNKSAKPGTGKTAIFNGHSGVGSAKGIFSRLGELTSGDEIRIEMGDGKVYTYRVYDNIVVKLEDANKKMSLLQISPVDGQESISIITCTGEYSLKQKTYLSRQFLRATRVE